MIEAFEKIELLSGNKMIWSYSEKAREGDHIVYYSNLNKMIKRPSSMGSYQKSRYFFLMKLI